METEIARLPSQFCTTRWSVVLMAGQSVSPRCSDALERLCQTYWLPVCSFAQRRGWELEDAKDLTQQFFSTLLKRNDFYGLDPKKGKFRTFLLTAFTHFLANEYDRSRAQKRGGGRVVSLEDASVNDFHLATEFAPAAVFDLHWAETILQTTLAQLEAEMCAEDRQAQFRELKAFLAGNGTAADYALAATRLAVKDTSVPVLVHRLRQRYRELARAEVAQTVASPLDLDEEMRHLFAVLNQ